MLLKAAWMDDDAAAALFDALEGAGGRARFVGGCVRDALLGRPVADVDLATDLRPDATTAALRRAGISVVPTGLAHGTVTAVFGRRGYEITTLRVDVETDGRHARVQFTDDWRADAARRDFTMNALSAERDGTLHDYFGGVADARAGCIRFVGKAAERVAEDGLRILRFFRFFAHYGQPPADAEALAACRNGLGMIAQLSGERIRTELLKLLAAPDPVPTWRLMAEVGVAEAALGTVGDLGRLANLVPVEPRPDPLRRLAALLRGTALARPVAKRLRLSGQERGRLVALTPSPSGPVARDDDDLRRALYRHGRDLARDMLLLAWAERPDDAAYAADLARLEAMPQPVFPIAGRDALALGTPAGPAVGQALTAVEAWWRDAGCRPDRAACLDRLALTLRSPAPPPAGPP